MAGFVVPPPAEFVAAVRERVGWAVGSGSALGGAVRVRVAPGGALVDVELTGGAIEVGAAGLGDAVRAAVRAAAGQARSEFDAASGLLLGTGARSALAWLPEPGAVLAGRLPAEAEAFTEGVTGVGSSPDGTVRAVCGPAGELLDLQVTSDALSHGPDGVAAGIRAAVSAACAGAAAEVIRRRREAGPRGRADLSAVLDRIERDYPSLDQPGPDRPGPDRPGSAGGGRG